MNQAQAEFELTLAQGNVKKAMGSAGASSSDLWKVDPRKLRVMPGFNVRMHTPEYEAHIEAIAQSIVENGYYPDKPIAGFVAREEGENVIYVTDGHTRLAAVMRAIERGHAIEFIPVVVKPQGTSMEDLTVALVKSNEGRPLTPMEIGTVCKRLLGLGLDEKTVAQRLGITRGYVDDLLMLVGADRRVRQLVESGEVAATLAISELKSDIEAAPKRLADAVLNAKAAGKQRATKKHLEQRTPDAEPQHDQRTQRPEPPAAILGGEIEAMYSLGEAIIRFTRSNDQQPFSGLACGLRLDDYIDALIRLRDEANEQFADSPEQTPNEHGTYTNAEEIRSPNFGSMTHAVIYIAKVSGGWTSSIDYWLAVSGGGSLPSIHCPVFPTRTQALAAAAVQLEKQLGSQAERAEQSVSPNAQIKSIKQILKWVAMLPAHISPNPQAD